MIARVFIVILCLFSTVSCANEPQKQNMLLQYNNPILEEWIADAKEAAFLPNDPDSDEIIKLIRIFCYKNMGTIVIPDLKAEHTFSRIVVLSKQYYYENK